METEYEIKLNLLENGLHFIQDSTESILKSDRNNLELKYSILHISSGIELILKELLYQEHWTLIFENINSANKKDLHSGNFKSVTFQTCIDRLKNINNLELSQNELEAIKTLRDYRNKIEHFSFSLNIISLKLIIAKVLIVTIRLINEKLSLSDLITCTFLYESIIENSEKFKDFSNLLEQEVKEKIKHLEIINPIILKCPLCLTSSLIISEDKKHCITCNTNFTPQELAYTHVRNILYIDPYSQIPPGPIFHCPLCGEASFVLINEHDFVCFNCARKIDEKKISLCERCGEPYCQSTREINFCKDCLKELMRD